MSEYIINNIDSKRYIEAIPPTFIIENEQDALDIAAVCGENETSLLLLYYENLAPGFFDLRTGLAGAILQKFVMYRIRVAAVIPSENIKGRFREMVVESNRGSHFRVFERKDYAIKWLINEK